MNVSFPIALGSFRRPGQLFVVDPDGRGDYSSIGAAVADVEAQGSHFLFGATTRPVILVMPGLYEESPADRVSVSFKTTGTGAVYLDPSTFVEQKGDANVIRPQPAPPAGAAAPGADGEVRFDAAADRLYVRSGGSWVAYDLSRGVF